MRHSDRITKVLIKNAIELPPENAERRAEEENPDDAHDPVASRAFEALLQSFSHTDN